MYEKIEDLPVVCQLNLPEPALHVYRRAFNEAFRAARDHRVAQTQAWLEVKKRFEKDKLSGRWIEQPVRKRTRR